MTTNNVQTQSIQTIATSIASAIEASKSLSAKEGKELRSLLRQASAEARRIGKTSKKAPVKKAAAAVKTAKKAPVKKAVSVKPAAKKVAKKTTTKVASKVAPKVVSKVSAPKVTAKPAIAQVRRSKKQVVANGLAH